MTQPRFKVVRVDRGGSRAPMEDEARELARVGAELVGADSSSEEETIAAARDADIILTAAAQITRRVIEALPRLQAVVRYGIGYDTIDVDAATDNGVLVINIPDFCLEEVSTHAILLLLACNRRLTLFNRLVKEGRWSEWWGLRTPMGSIYGQTLGLVGCGNIGRSTARKARVFDLRVIGHDPYVDRKLAEEAGIELVDLPELLKESDYVSLHTPLNKETWHLIGENELKQMKPTAYLINTARGSVVDEPALIQALREGWIAGAGLDVFEQEPVDPDNPLLKMDNVIATPHSASYCDASFKRLFTSVGQEAARVLSGHWPRNWVNKGVRPRKNLT